MQSAKDYLKKTAQGFEQLAEIFSREPSLHPTTSSLRKRADDRRHDRFGIMIVGEFKRGKSTFVNALVGHDFLPRRATPCTAVMCRVQYAGTSGVMMEFADGTAEQSMSIEEFKKRYQIDLNEDAMPEDDDGRDEWELNAKDKMDNVFGPVRQARFFHPAELCRDGVELIDTPGLAEDVRREATVLKNLGDAQAVLFVCSATHPLGIREVRFLRRKLEQFHRDRKLFVVVNYWNHIMQQAEDPQPPQTTEEFIEETRQHIFHKVRPFLAVDGTDLTKDRVFFIDALSALNLRTGKKEGDIETTGVPALERALTRFLIVDRRAAERASDRTLIDTAEDSLTRQITFEEINAAKSVDEVEKDIAAHTPELEWLKRSKKHIETYLSDRAHKSIHDLCTSLRTYIEKNIRETVEADFKTIEIGEAGHLTKQFGALFDIFRKDENKIKRRIVEQLIVTIRNYLTSKLQPWMDDVRDTYFTQLEKDIEEELRKEAEVYAEARSGLEQLFGGGNRRIDVPAVFDSWRQQVAKTLGESMNQTLSETFKALFAGAMADAFGQVLLSTAGQTVIVHASSGGLTLVLEAALMWRRKRKLNSEVRKKLVLEVEQALPQLQRAQEEAIRREVNASFEKLSSAIGATTGAEIAQLEATLDGFLDRKRQSSESFEERRQFLSVLRDEFVATANEIRTHLSADPIAEASQS